MIWNLLIIKVVRLVSLLYDCFDLTFCELICIHTIILKANNELARINCIIYWKRIFFQPITVDGKTGIPKDVLGKGLTASALKQLDRETRPRKDSSGSEEETKWVRIYETCLCAPFWALFKYQSGFFCSFLQGFGYMRRGVCRSENRVFEINSCNVLKDHRLNSI